MTTFTSAETFVVMICGKCGISFGLPEDFYNARREDHEGFYCPNGHSRYFPQKTEAERLKEQLRQKERELVRERSEHDQTAEELKHTEAKRRAAKGQLTKFKNRLGKGGCPCCKRYFKDLDRHMKNKHPDYAEA